MTTRERAEEKQKQKDATATQAMELAKTSIDDALKFMKECKPWDFLHHQQW
jgi:hypothetical protein